MLTHPGLVERGRFVLVIIDVQERLAAVMSDRDRLLVRVPQLVRLASLLGVPIIVTRQYPRGLGDTEPIIAAAVSAAEATGAAVSYVDKTSFCACGEPEFLSALEATGRDQVIIAGMETHICVVQTALELLNQGHRVQVVADATCSRDPKIHEVALDRLRSAGIVVTATESVLYEGVGVADSDEFRALLEIVKSG